MSSTIKLLLIGGTGLIGSAITRQAISSSTSTNSPYTVLTLSRTGTGSITDPNVVHHKGSALDPSTFRSLLTGTTAVVHTVGTILDQKKYGDQGTYEKLNRDAIVTVARELAAEKGENENRKCLVYFSAANAPMGFVLDERYIGTKREAENILLSDEFKNSLRVVIFRPGIVYSYQQRQFMVPIAFGAILTSVLLSPFKAYVPESLAFVTDRPLPDETISKAVLRAVECEEVEGVVDIAKIQQLAQEWEKVHRK